MAVTVSVNSRLNLTELRLEDGVEFFEAPIVQDFPEQDDDIFITVEENTRMDLLAYKYYGDPSLYWVIMQANELMIAPFGIFKGKKIRIPNRNRVIGAVLRSKE
jgi:nucleoid-associated protein YgaU